MVPLMIYFGFRYACNSWGYMQGFTLLILKQLISRSWQKSLNIGKVILILIKFHQ